MKTIKLEEIQVDDERQRQTFDVDALKKLASSISEVGLIHAPLLHEDDKTLVAGERRLRAIRMLYKGDRTFKYDGEPVPFGEVPYTTMADADEELRQKAELYENAVRLDLTWQEKDAAVLKVKRIVEAKHGGEKVDNKQVAQELLAAKGEDSPSESKVYQEREKVHGVDLRAQYADDPRIQNAKSASEADRIIKKDLQEKKRQDLAKKFSEVETEHEIIFGNCCEKIKEVADGSIDVIVSDPIYGIGANSMHMFQRVQYKPEGTHHVYDDSIENWMRMFDVMPEELFRVCKDEAAVYLFCDINRFFDFQYQKEGNKKPSLIKGLASRMTDAGFNVWPRPLVWYKGNIGSLPKPEHGPRYTSEYVLFATLGDKKTTKVEHDVICINQQAGQSHAAGKPPELYFDLLSRSAYPGDTVLDFNAGSFPILVAANELGAKAVAMEMDERYRTDADLRKVKKLGE